MSLTQVILDELEKARRGEESKFQRKFDYNPSSLIWEFHERENPKALRDVGWRLELVSVYGSLDDSARVTVNLVTLYPLCLARVQFSNSVHIIKTANIDLIVMGCSRHISHYTSERLETAFEEFKL